MAKKILNFAIGGLVGGLLGGGGKKEAAPAPTSEKPMPMADDEAIRRARKRSISQQMGRGGRSSTILSTDSETLGG